MTHNVRDTVDTTISQPRFGYQSGLIFVLGSAVRILLIHSQPVIYGGDSVMRLMNRDKILVAYQLPLLQLLLYLTNLISQDVLISRYLMALIGAAAGVGFYRLSLILWGGRVALLASLFFVFNPFLLVHSLVPYQEILMLLALTMGLAYLFQCAKPQDFGKASLWLGLACLTRYEAWIITGSAALFHLSRGMRSRIEIPPLNQILKTLLYFGWAPLVWILLHRGISSEGTFVLESSFQLARLYRLAYVFAMTLGQAGPIVVVPLALVGLARVGRNALWKDAKVQTLVLGTSLFFLALLFSAHGVPPDPVRYVTSREAHWPLLSVFWLAALGLSAIEGGPATLSIRNPQSPTLNSSGGRSRWRTAVAFGLLTLVVLNGVYQTNQEVTRLVSEPKLKLDFQVAKYLERNLAPGKKALVFAQPLPENEIRDYLQRARAAGGEKSVEAARRNIAQFAGTSSDHSRIVVNTYLPKQRILASGALGGQQPLLGPVPQPASPELQLVVVFSDYVSSDPAQSKLLEAVRRRSQLKDILSAGGFAATIYEVRS